MVLCILHMLTHLTHTTTKSTIVFFSPFRRGDTRTLEMKLLIQDHDNSE